MKRLLSVTAILALPLLLGSCAVLNRALQAPARLIQSGVRTLTSTPESSDPGAAKVALEASAPTVR